MNRPNLQEFSAICKLEAALAYGIIKFGFILQELCGLNLGLGVLEHSFKFKAYSFKGRYPADFIDCSDKTGFSGPAKMIGNAVCCD